MEFTKELGACKITYLGMVGERHKGRVEAWGCSVEVFQDNIESLAGEHTMGILTARMWKPGCVFLTISVI